MFLPLGIMLKRETGERDKFEDDRETNIAYRETDCHALIFFLPDRQCLSLVKECAAQHRIHSLM